MSERTEIPELFELRRLLMDDALNDSFKGGRLKVLGGGPSRAFDLLRRELSYASFVAHEFSDPDGPFTGDPRARDAAMNALRSTSDRFGHEGRVLDAGTPSPYFTLVPFTRALLSLKPHVEGSWCDPMVDRGVQLYADAAAKINRTHDYLNPRALEAVSCLGLHRLTGDQDYMDRCTECLDELLLRQYPCGALPYHTGLWIWGRRAAQAYQFLCATLMLYLGFQLDRRDVIECVRRIADYSLLATNRRGEAFVTTFEGLHKARTRGCAGRQWVVTAALADERFRGLSRTTYELWVSGVMDFLAAARGKSTSRTRGGLSLDALNDGLHIGIRNVPTAEPFVPTRGSHALEDISTVFVHEAQLDISMTVLSGYSAFAEADCGNVKLFAVTPELTDAPTFRNAGTDSLRADWRVPSEQIECSIRDGRAVLSGSVYTKWENGHEKDFTRLHNRRLAVTMTYAEGEMVLEYETTKNRQTEPVPSRLLFLLIARPPSASPRLHVGDELDTSPPPAESEEPFRIEAPVGVVRFSAPDGSTIEIVPELSAAQCVTAERPATSLSPGPPQKGGPGGHSRIKPANEGSLRVAFEGLHTLDRGRYRIRFRPGQ